MSTNLAAHLMAAALALPSGSFAGECIAVDGGSQVKATTFPMD